MCDVSRACALTPLPSLILLAHIVLAVIRDVVEPLPRVFGGQKAAFARPVTWVGPREAWWWVVWRLS